MGITVIRTGLLYGLLILAVRLMGKRQVAEMEPAEFVVTMLLANLAAVPMQDNGLPLISGVAPIFTVLGLELVLAVLSMKFLPVRRLLNGVPTLLIRDGRIDQKALAISRVSLDELQQKLREKDVFDYTQVAYAVLETDGELTIMLFPKYQNVTASDVGVKHPSVGLFYNVISDGVVLRDNLKLAGVDEAWLKKELRRQKCKKKDAFLLAVNALGEVHFLKREK